MARGRVMPRGTGLELCEHISLGEYSPNLRIAPTVFLTAVDWGGGYPARLRRQLRRIGNPRINRLPRAGR